MRAVALAAADAATDRCLRSTPYRRRAVGREVPMDPLTIVFAIIAIGALVVAVLLGRRSRTAPRSELDPAALRALVADAIADASQAARGAQDGAAPGAARHRAAAERSAADRRVATASTTTAAVDT